MMKKVNAALAIGAMVVSGLALAPGAYAYPSDCTGERSASTTTTTTSANSGGERLESPS